MALCTPEELTRRLALRKADFRWRGEAVDPATHPEFTPTLISWGSWLYQAAFDPETAETMVARPDLNGEECHVFWHMATSAEDLLQNLKAAQLLAERSPLTRLREHRPRRAAGAAGRDARRRPGARHELPRARRRLRPALPARAADDGRRGHRRQGRPQQAAGRAGRPRHVPARRRAPRRRHRRARRQGAHVGLGRRGGADRDPDARDARGRGRRLRGRVRDPGRHAGHHARRARASTRQRQRVGGADLVPRRAGRDVHGLQRRVRAVRARVPLRRVASTPATSPTRSRASTARATSAPSRASCACSSAPRQRIAELNGVAGVGHIREKIAQHDQDGALDLGARRGRLARELHRAAATRSPTRCSRTPASITCMESHFTAPAAAARDRRRRGHDGALLEDLRRRTSSRWSRSTSAAPSPARPGSGCACSS